MSMYGICISLCTQVNRLINQPAFISRALNPAPEGVSKKKKTLCTIKTRNRRISSSTRELLRDANDPRKPAVF